SGRRSATKPSSAPMISVARAKAEELEVRKVDFQVGDSYSLPFEDGCFDIILFFNTLHFLKEPQRVLKEAYRLLKPDGSLALATDCFAEPVPFLTRIKLSAQNLLKTMGIIPFMWNYSKEDLHKLLEENSFVIEETQVLHQVPVNYYLLGRKTTP
ncbi:MAG TPA: class I SAM-dependent methyltransferase, partial [Synergistales bacterium]|nr:class I SAM-dependent methyltransferase [Synergistales bacterium]